MRTILFRADGNSNSGLGHLYRIFALIEIYKSKYHCVLLTRSDSTTEVIPEAYQFKTLPAGITVDQEPLWLSQNFPAKECFLVADGYHFNAHWQKHIKQLGFQLLYVDDLVAEHMYADVVVNHSMSVSSRDYKSESYTRIALGTHYAILRPGFLRMAALSRSIESLTRAFVCFGGADSLDLTLKATKALLNIDAIQKVNVIVGGAYLHQEIFELQKQTSRLNVYKNLSEEQLIEVMNRCDLGVAPSSNILYELCAVKVPLLSGYYVDNQMNIYKGGLEKGIFMGGGDFTTYTEKDFEERVRALMAGKNYHKYLEAQQKLFDAHIKERFLDLVAPLGFRKAVWEDMELIYIWSNDKLSRANSYFSEPIPLKTHQAWFKKKLGDKNCRIFIATVDSDPAGMVRYETNDEHSVVGILVAKKYRGRGLAVNLLKHTALLYFKECSKPIWAYIKKENVASVRSFERAGYVKLREDVVRGSDSFVYEFKE